MVVGFQASYKIVRFTRLTAYFDLPVNLTICTFILIFTSIFQMVDKVECCSICASVGKASKLKIYQINLKEAVKLCEDKAVSFILLSLRFKAMQLTMLLIASK